MQNYIDYRKVKKPLQWKNLTVEIGFGSGDYILKLAKENKNEIFFGIEKSWIPVNKLIKKCEKANIKNVFCIKLDAYWAFQLLFRDCSVKRIIMNYPDPWFKKSHEEKRLTKRENLYIYAKKLMPQGEIRIRTDDRQFFDFTLKECDFIECFSINFSNPIIDVPLTKYEKKWLLMNKTIWDILLRKEKEPLSMEIKEIKEVKKLFPIKIEMENLNIKNIAYKEFKVEEGLYLKCFSIWERDQDFAIEALLSEQGFLQSFIVTIKRKRDCFIIDISKFSEALKTEGVKKSLNFLSEILKKEKI